jgi:hypothetical protein
VRQWLMSDFHTYFLSLFIPANSQDIDEDIPQTSQSSLIIA